MATDMPPVHPDLEPVSGEAASNPTEQTHTYTGYKPVSALDYPYDDDLNTSKSDSAINPQLLRDKGKTSKSLILSIILFSLSFITIFVWQILIAKCQVDLLCNTNDRSSTDSTDYVFKTLTFRVPSALAWVGLTAGSLSMTVASVLAFLLLRKSVGAAKVVEIASIVRKASSALIIRQNLAVLLPVMILFIWFGVALNWRTAGCFMFGAMLGCVVSQSAASVFTRGNIRTCAAAQTGVIHAYGVAFRTCSVISLTVAAVSVAAPSAMYLIFSDIRALTAMITGASVVALYVALSTCIFNRSAKDTFSVLHNLEAFDNDGTRVAAAAAGIGQVSAVGSDVFASILGVVIATAVVGSSLPFFYRNPFALCVFNHLAIDQTCGPFGFPEQLSYATYICSNDNLYLEYPVLKTWASNTAFVAAPFVLAVIALLVSVVCLIFVRRGKDAVVLPCTFGEITSTVHNLRRKLLVNMIFGYILLVSAAAALCFGLFGSHSAFQQSNGFGNGQLLTKMKLDGAQDQCVSKFLDSQGDAQLSPFPVPQGGFLIPDHYSPTTIAGLSLGVAHSAAWRLFVCILIGLALSALIIITSANTFVLECKGFTRRLFNAVKLSTGLGMTQSMATGLLYTAIPSVLIIAAVIGSYNLYGPYGTGMTALGFLSPFGLVLGFTTLGYVSDGANNLAWEANLSRSTKQNASLVSVTGMLQVPLGMEYFNGASFLSAIIIILAFVQETAILPSPSDLIGSPEEPPTRIITDVFVVSLTDFYTLISVFIGAFLPILVTGLVMTSTNITTNTVFAEMRQQRLGRSKQQLPDYATVFGKASRIALVEAFVPLIIAVAIPLAIAFGFGSQAVVAFLVSLVSSGYMIGTVLTSSTSNWTSVKQLVSTRSLVSAREDGAGEISNGGVNFSDSGGSSLQTLTKVCTCVSLSSASLVKHNGTNGWIGGVILAVTIVFVALLVILKRGMQRRLAGAVEDSAEEVRAPPKQVSPFYEDGHRIDGTKVRIGSQMHEALEALGNPGIPIGVEEVPGLSDRDETDLGGSRREFTTPRGAMRIEESVFEDVGVRDK